MPNYKLTIEYDGTGLVGWQSQPGAPSVQGYIEDAVYKLTGERTKIFCAGRTDAGVHAFAQVGHFVLEKSMPSSNIRDGINFYLATAQISILSAHEVDSTFHARFSATKRHYRYRIINRASPLAIEAHRAWWLKSHLDADAMQEAAKYLVGEHDFTSFRDSSCQANSPIKTLDLLNVTRENDEVILLVSARSFLHHMVRNLTGTLVMVGKHKWEPKQVQSALLARDRSAAGPTAPAQGLYLTHVSYES
jgi:tRNA pseudouridine38-40 synthase